MSNMRSARRDRPRSNRSAVAVLTAGLMMSGAVLAVSPANAQDTTTWLDAITVVGTRTAVSVQNNPVSVTVIDQEQLERRAPESIAEMLRDVPGVEVVDASAPGMKRIRIRGESSHRVTILVDGQEITDHSTYGTPILVDPANVERIDVVRGPASVLYGAKAIGGVINIITKRGAAKPVQAELGGTYYSGTDGWRGWGAVSGTVGSVDYRLFGLRDEHNDREVPKGQYTSTGVLDGTAFDNDDLSLHLGYAFGSAKNHYLAFKAEQHRLTTESWTDPATLVYPITDFRIELPQRDRQKIGLYYDGKDLGPVLRNVHLDAYYQTIDRQFLNEVVMAPLPGRTVGVVSTSDDQILNYGGTAQADFQFHRDHYTIVGFHYLTDNLEAEKTSTTTTTGFGPRPIVTATGAVDDAAIYTASAFIQDEWTFAPDFKLTAGMRYYHTETELDYTSDAARKAYQGKSDDRIVASAGITYTGLQDTTLRALFSEGYITPTLLQLFTDSTAGRGTLTYGNPDLDPETSKNYEIGARYNAHGLVFDAAAFYADAEDYIATVRCGAGVPCPAGAPATNYIYMNTDTATTYGVELSADYTLPGTAFTPYVNGAWMRRKMEFQDYVTYNNDVPELAGRFGVKYETDIAGIHLWSDLFVRASSGVELTSRNTSGVLITEELSSWTTLNFAFGGTFGVEQETRLSVHLNNLTDEEYRSSFNELPGTGRSIEVSAQVKF